MPSCRGAWTWTRILVSDVLFELFDVLFRVGVIPPLLPGESDRDGDVVTARSDPGLIMRWGRCCGDPACDDGDDGFVTFAVATIVPLLGEFSFGFGEMFRGGMYFGCPFAPTFVLSPITSFSWVCFCGDFVRSVLLLEDGEDVFSTIGF